MSKQNPARSKGLYWQAVSLFLAGMVLGSPTVNFAKSGAASAAPALAALSVETDPVGAAVYVDGKFAGQTPLRIGELPVGDHRVRVVKDGYLENSRLVSVSQRTNVVQVKLTPSATTGATTVAAAPTGSSKKWLWIAIGGGAAAAGTIAYVATKNAAPTVSTISPSTTTGLQSGAGIAFSANGSDKDGDTVNYSWDFGDGTTDSSPTPTHSFLTVGNLTVKVTVSDSKHDNAASATTGVTIKNLNGTWRGTLLAPSGNLNTVVTLTQTGASLSGGYADQLPGTGSVSGSVKSSTPIVTFTVSIPGVTPFTFTGSPSGDINSLSGQGNGSGLSNSPWTLTRQ
jgi:hypothetical protein